MTIRFRTAVASARGAFMEGQTVQVAGFPQEWQSWLDAGLLEVLPETSGERAVTDPPAYAVSPRGRGRGRRTAAVA